MCSGGPCWGLDLWKVMTRSQRVLEAGRARWGGASVCSPCSYVLPKALSVGHCWIVVWINLQLFCSCATALQGAWQASETEKDTLILHLQLPINFPLHDAMAVEG